jgi:hypothetical protein
MDISNTSTDLSQALGISPPTLPATSNTSPVGEAVPVSGDVLEGVPASDSQIFNDAEFARSKVYDVISRGTAAIDLAANVAMSMQTPWAISVLGQLLKIQAENIDGLLRVQKDRKELTDIITPVSNSNIKIDKAVVFSGTSDELVRMIRNEEKNIIDVDVENGN